MEAGGCDLLKVIQRVSRTNTTVRALMTPVQCCFEEGKQRKGALCWVEITREVFLEKVNIEWGFIRREKASNPKMRVRVIEVRGT